MKKILVSLGVIVAVGAIVIGATGAFFSDTETSVGNTFTAGDIDLQIDNESYVTDVNGDLVASPNTSWELRDLTVEKFFDFDDLKPGDLGEDTISIHVGSNDAWVCAAAQITEDSDVTYTEPEEDDDNTVNLADPLGTDGELDEELNFAFWIDDGDNVYETCQDQGTSTDCVSESFFLEGTLSEMGQAGQIALADASGNAALGDDPVPGEDTFYIGKAWCFGELTPDPVPQDGVGKTNPNTNGPLARDTGVDCDGANVDNASQTDRVVGDLQFYAEQSRNNDDFLCEDWQPDFQVPAPREEVGEDLASYQVPGQCDATVTSGNSIQTAIDAASQNQTICVDDGTYAENIEIDIVGLTLAGLNGPTNTATIDGQVIVNATDVTVTGLEILGDDDVPGFGTNGVYVVGGSDNLTLSYNVIDGATRSGASPRGIHFEVGGTTNVTVMNNVVQNWTSAGTYINPTAGPMSFTYNDYLDNNVGIGSDGINDVDIMFNHFSGNTAEAIGMSEDVQSVTDVVINTNNFVPAGAGNNVNAYDLDGVNTLTADATGNHWDGEVEGARTNDTVNVDTSSPEAVAFPHQ